MAKFEAMTFEEAAPTEVERLMQSEKWAAELKLDGVRCVADVLAGNVTLMNRKGAPLRAASTNAHRPAIEAALRSALPVGEWVLDGEIMSDGRYWLFDVIRADSVSDERDPLFRRREVLEHLSAMLGWDADDSLIRVVTQVRGDDKRALLESTRRVGGEGIMLKYVDAPYVPGKRVRTGLKLKLTKTVDAVVVERDSDGHTNATLAVYDADGELVEIGACSMIGKVDAQVGDVVEVRFLYVGANGRLYQPRMIRVRDDKAATECTIAQLHGLGVNKEVAG